MALFREHQLTDLHIHILPGLDDGAQTMAEAVEMARIAVRSGVRNMVVTPHANQRGRFENYATSYMEQIFETFCRELQDQHIPLRVFPGMEIYASDDVEEHIRRKMLCPLAGTQYFLIEFPFQAPAVDIENILQKMLLHDHIPMIAHPERYRCIQENPRWIGLWRKMGCVSQVNRGSLQGRFGPSCQRVAGYLLAHGQIDVFGTDAHGTTYRTPEMESLYDYLVHWGGTEEAKRLMIRNPQRLLQGQNLAE